MGVQPVKIGMAVPDAPPGSKRPRVDFNLRSETTEKISLPNEFPNENFKSRHKLWVDKYSPRELTDVVGNTAKVHFLKEWLAKWHTVNSIKGSRRPKAIMISGAPGIGKSTAAKLVCRSLGFSYLEVNASDSRNKSSAVVAEGINGNLNSKIREMITSSTVAVDGRLNKMVLIMEEVDGMSSGDRGGVAELISVIKLTKIPIICVCNDRYSQRLRSLLAHCEECAFQRPLKQQVLKRLAAILNEEKVHVSQDHLVNLVETCDSDIRLILNQLQLLQMETLVDMVLSDDFVKDIPGNPFSIVDRLFASSSYACVQTRERCAISESELTPLFVQENYVNIRPNVAHNEQDRLHAVATAATRMSDADVMSKSVHNEQHWSLLPAFIACAAVLPSSVVAGKRETLSSALGERNFNRFPSLLGKISSRSKVQRLCSELSARFSSNRSCAVTSAQLRLECFPLIRSNTLREMTFVSKGGREHDGVDFVISFMKAYDLTRSDWETLHETTRLNGKGPMFQLCADVLSTKVKAAFTRACNRNLRGISS